jgi:hypothetical protein
MRSTAWQPGMCDDMYNSCCLMINGMCPLPPPLTASLPHLQDIILKKRLDELAAKHPDRFKVPGGGGEGRLRGTGNQ